MKVTLELEVHLQLSCRVISQRRRTAAAGAAQLGSGMGKEAGSCLQCPILLSCGGVAEEVVHRA